MYREVEGNLITMAYEGRFDAIVHGCNCFNIMGAGIARQIKRAFPEAFLTDQIFGEHIHTYNKLGCITASTIDRSGLLFQVVNAYTQFEAGKNLDYTALKMCLQKVNYYYQNQKVGLPQIGCGIAGGDWETVKYLIEDTLVDCDVTVVIYKI